MRRPTIVRIAEPRLDSRTRSPLAWWPLDLLLYLAFIGFDFSARIREFLEGQKLLHEVAEHRSERVSR